MWTMPHLDTCGGIPYSHGWPRSCFPRCHEPPIRANAEGRDLSSFVRAEIALAVLDTEASTWKGGIAMSAARPWALV